MKTQKNTRVHCVGPASLTGRPDQKATEVRGGGERLHSPPAPVADGVREARDSRQRDIT